MSRRAKGRRKRALVAQLIAALVWVVSGCTSANRHADQVAAAAGLERAVVQGDEFHHLTYSRIVPNRPLLIYLDGDGMPWTRGGFEVSVDPTVRHPLALELAAHSNSYSVLYLGRPCYYGWADQPECESADWTSRRYSAQIVASLVAGANRFIAEHAVQQVILIGHSGGGTLAVLMAPHVMNLRAVITIAGNLDVQAWTRYHGYLPLTGSLDPLREPALPEQVMELHLTGGRDREIPPALLTPYLAAHPHAQHWRYPRFDHYCCWADTWPELLPRLVRAALP